MMGEAPSLRWVGQAEHRLRRRKARHGALAELRELLRQVGGELRRSDDRLAELRRDLLQPRREIDRRPDAGEIEPVAAADIAILHLADVQREAEADRALAVARRLVQRLDQRAGLACGGERPAANLARVVAVS